MGQIKWYKRDPRAAILGMASLSLEERGAYNTILDLIYINDGALADNPTEICGFLKCDPRVWKRIRAKLIDGGKLYIHGGHLRNERADFETTMALRRVLVATEAADKRWSDYRKLNDLANAGAMLPTSTSRKILSLEAQRLIRGRKAD